VTVFGFRGREEEGPAGAVFPGPSIIAGGSPVVPSAPIGASYVTTATEAGLSNERVLTGGTQVTVVDGGSGGLITIQVDAIPTTDDIDLPGQSAGVAPIVILAGAAAGVYMVVATATVSTGAAAGTLSGEAQYTNNGAKTATAFSLFDLTVAGTTAGMATFQHTGGDITVSTTDAGLIGVPAYEAHFRLIRLG
jgi:hypothetical protein